MNILVIETSSGKASVAICKDKIISAFAQDNNVNKQAEHLFPLIDQVFATTSLNYADINYLATTTGPGSFTGIRVGLSTAKGINIAAKHINTIAFSNFQVLAFRALRQVSKPKHIVVIFQCSQESLYIQSFDDKLCPHDEATIISIDQISYYLKQYQNLTAITGNGIQTALERIPKAENFIILPRYPEIDARLVASLASYKLRFNKPISGELTPLYIKPVSAKVAD